MLNKIVEKLRGDNNGNKKVVLRKMRQKLVNFGRALF